MHLLVKVRVSSLLLFGAFFENCTKFNQQKLHELYQTTGTAVIDPVKVVEQITGASFGQSACFKFATFWCVF